MRPRRAPRLRAAVLTASGIAAALAAPACTDTSNNAAIDASLPAILDGGAVVDVSGTGREAGADLPPALQPGYLWFAGGGLSAFTQADTGASHDRGPAFVVVPPVAAPGFHDLAFDREGNLWTIPIGSDRIERIPASGLGNRAPPPYPDRVLTSAALARPQSLAFDGAGNLWVLNYDGAGPSVANIVRFDAPFAAPATGASDDGGASGDRAPSATLNPGAADRPAFNQAASIAFDAAGDLWLAAITSVARLGDAASARGTATASLAAVIGSGDGVFVALAFDANGALWITGAGTSYFVARVDGARQLTGRGDLAAAARVRLPSDGSAFAGGMALDGAGTLWIAMSNRIVALAMPGTLRGDVTSAPTITLGLPNPPDLASRLAFWPTPAGLPLY